MAVGSFLSFGIRAIMCRCNPFLSWVVFVKVHIFGIFL
jgi:hypothetical protein